MTTPTQQSAGKPPFEKCVRCGYLLRGLPAEHACPECGLRYDARCERYRVINPHVILAVYAGMFATAWIVIKGLPNLFRWSMVSWWDRIHGLAGIAWIVMIGLVIWILVRYYRAGQEVAVTGDGLLLRLFGFNSELVPWSRITAIAIKPHPKQRIALVTIEGRNKPVEIGAPQKVFRKADDLERFIEQVNHHVQGPPDDA